MRRCALKRYTPLRSNPEKTRAWKQRTAVRLKPGKKTNEWSRIRAILKPRFAAAGITTCEVRFDGCWGDNGLGFLHRKKRRKCDTAELWRVALGCNHCHDIAEAMKPQEMFDLVDGIIRNRARQP